MGDQPGALRRIRGVADYQFGRGAGERLFPEGVQIVFSRRTGRVRQVFLGGQMVATLRARDGLLCLTVEGARRLWREAPSRRLWVRVSTEAEPFVSEGRSLFARHVEDADAEIRPREEVVVVNGRGEVVAVGRAVLTGREMRAFRSGVAVRVRRGAAEES